MQTLGKICIQLFKQHEENIRRDGPVTFQHTKSILNVAPLTKICFLSRSQEAPHQAVNCVSAHKEKEKMMERFIQEQGHWYAVPFGDSIIQ
jgi:hypothetical protein